MVEAGEVSVSRAAFAGVCLPEMELGHINSVVAEMED